eukprot:TRINITY_DN37327_c0_g2_i1.p1 TRINITY_DN37327_c0_g2~~TRINITY_DN37327_c0_g2_i1.p1  ORF type:complete len:340 (+),score=68.34 TRINITY_DN37327_c0_g2_i1:30-1049(+)
MLPASYTTLPAASISPATAVGCWRELPAQQLQSSGTSRRSVLGVAIVVLAAAGRPRPARGDGLQLAGPQGAQPPPSSTGVSEQVKRLSEDDKRKINQLIFRASQLASLPGGSEAKEEEAWSDLLQQYGWVPEIEARGVMNRGNARARQGKFADAVSDYGRAIQMAPGEPDPYLNRGASYEALGRFEDALADYSSVLAINQRDPAAWNNRGNALLALGRYADASSSFKAALELAPGDSYAFPALQLAIAEHELGDDENALKRARELSVRYADQFPEARAVYALLMWEKGDRVTAESEWDSATFQDSRYRSLEWVTSYRRWPTRLKATLQQFAATSGVKVK